MAKKIVVIGAGYSGILTTKKLVKELQGEEVDITLVDKNPFHTMLTELHEVAAGRIDEHGIRMDIRKIFSQRKVSIVTDQVMEIQFEEKKVVTRDKEIPFDYLVLAAGSKPNFFGISGAEEYAFSLWSYKDALTLQKRFQEVFCGAAGLADEKERRKLLSFWVVGAGFSGVEMMGELQEYIPYLCKKYNVDSHEVSLHIVDGLSRVIPNLTPKLSEKAEKKMKRRGIEVLLNQKVAEIGPDFICLKEEEVLRTYDAGTVIWTAGTQMQTLTQGLEHTLESVRCRIQVDEYLRSVTNKHVYVVGDDMYFVVEGEERPVPQMVENCEQSAHIAAHNLSYDITGKGEKKPYRPSFHGVMVSIGSKDGVASVGVGGHFISLSGFMAVAAKHAINILYFFQVLGWNKVSQYLFDEIFSIRNRRSLVGGHFSNRTPSLFLVPLRFYVGLMWCMLGIGEVHQFAGIHGAASGIAGMVEIGLGVALMSGLFTSIASIVSFIFFCMFSSNIGGNCWMIFANIVLLGGAGRVFGLDYYVLPKLNQWWKSRAFVKKWYLYVD